VPYYINDDDDDDDDDDEQHRQEHDIVKESLLYEFMDRLLLTSVRDARQLFQVISIHVFNVEQFFLIFLSWDLLFVATRSSLSPTADFSSRCDTIVGRYVK
jgi:hypothetical protein